MGDSTPSPPSNPRGDHHDLLARLAQRVSRRRASLGLSIKECAARSGLSARYWIQIESGQANVSLIKLSQLCETLEIRVAELLSDGERGRIDQLLSQLSPEALSEAYQLLSARFLGHQRALISLLGVRGAGKSTLGRALSERLGWDFIELDEEIERDAGLTLAELFTVHGEPYYRRLEGEALRRLQHRERPAVIATGGSIVTHPEHYALLRALSHTAYLHTTPEEHMRRVIAQGDQRPMRDHPHAMSALRALIQERAPLYRAAELQLDTTELKVETALERLVAWALGELGVEAF